MNRNLSIFLDVSPFDHGSLFYCIGHYALITFSQLANFLTDIINSRQRIITEYLKTFQNLAEFHQKGKKAPCWIRAAVWLRCASLCANCSPMHGWKKALRTGWCSVCLNTESARWPGVSLNWKHVSSIF